MTDIALVEDVVERIGELPVMSAVVGEFVMRADDPSTTMDELVHVIERDPVLAAKVLRVSNSPYYGMRQHVGTLKLALVILGSREVRNLVLGLSVTDMAGMEHIDPIFAKGYRLHSYLVAALTRRLANEVAGVDAGEAFVGGLLHDIGKIVLARRFGAEYAKIHNDNKAFSEQLCAAERSQYGFSHAEVSAALSITWSFPESLSDALWLHHYDPKFSMEQAKNRKLAAVVRVANYCARNSEPNAAKDIWEEPDMAAVWRCLGILEPDACRALLQSIHEEMIAEAETLAAIF